MYFFDGRGVLAALFLTMSSAAWSQATDPIGPCNANYDFVCDEEGNCTCEKKAPVLEVLSYSLGYAVYVGAGERLEILPNFDPDPNSSCEIDYRLEFRLIEGGSVRTTLGSSPGTLSPLVSNKRHTMASPNGGFVAIKGDATGSDCTWGEARTFNLPFVIKSGFGAVSHRGALKSEVSFPSLGDGELPPILPADSSVGQVADEVPN